MLTSAIALSFLQAAASAQPAQAGAPAGWRVASGEQGCLVHTTDRAGTVLSVFALPGHEGIGFLLQNRKWTSLRDGQLYPLSIRFDGCGEWPIPALARTGLDEDGPGLFFAIRPGSEEGGRDFISDFANARGMRIANDGTPLDDLRLADSRGATVALARCLSTMMRGERNPFADSEGAGTATRI